MITVLLLAAAGGCLARFWWADANARFDDTLAGLLPPTTQADVELAA